VRTLRDRAATTLIAVATALGIVAIVMPLFLNPIWVAFEQGRAEASAWSGFTESDLRAATDAILADLVFGPPAFDVQVDGATVLNERERGHMRDVRTVFLGFFALAIGLGVAAVAVATRRRRAGDGASTWRAIRGGAIGLIVVLLVGGLLSVVTFDLLFEVFHRIFFAGGSYTFDPATERLVQLFPFRFWQETAMALGAVCIVVAGLVVVGTSSRARPVAAPALVSRVTT
jgi:integral membrane protein (TIGR01906 family)